ncbi:MAG: zinc-ribbon domain-containing protein [Patescibacteria group bacterium]
MKELYEYQRVALERVNERLRNHDSALLVMASGLGKSVVAANWAKEQLAYGRGLVLCHDTNILEQLAVEFKEAFDRVVSFGMFNGRRKDVEDVSLLFATFQTLKTWKQVFLRNEFAFVVVDEAHHSEADTFRKVIEYLKPRKTLAMTATPDRMDGRDIRSLFGDEVVEISLEEAIAKNWLSNIEYRMVTDDLNTAVLREILKELGTRGHRVSIKQLNETIFIRKRDEEVAKIIRSYNKKTIVFCEGIEHVEAFIKHLPGAKSIHSHNSPKENQQALDGFHNGDFKYILSVNQFNEGIDVPDAEVVVFLRCTNSKRIFLQQLGRGLRKKTGKEKVIVLDFVGNCDRVIEMQEMMKSLFDFAGKHWEKEGKIYQHVEGTGFKFIFSEEFRDIADIIHKVQTKLYISDIPHLLAEYDREKNPLPPEQVRAGTNQPIHWICSKGHEWQAIGNSRSAGRDCPICAKRVVTKDNCLAATHPELAKEFHPKKNTPLTVYNVMAGTSRKLHWICSKGHEWQATGSNMVAGGGCPVCANKVVAKDNCLAATHPELVKEFHPTKNAPLTVYNVIAGTHRRIYWVCSKGHEWQATGSHRVAGGSCPACVNRVVTKDNCLATTHPELAKEFHPTKNAPFTVYNVIAGTHRRLYWLCFKGHEWQARGYDRVIGGGCPACANRVVTKDNCLAATHPELAKEFHPTKNAPLTAYDVVAGTNKKLWWLCSNRHEWQATGSTRVKGKGCLECYLSRRSGKHITKMRKRSR